MQIVINVDNELYEYFSKRRSMHDDGYFSHVGKLIKALREGTLLPKGHGELIDRDKIEYLKAIHDAKYGHISWIDAIEKIKHSAPTIIEADKERSE